MKTRFIILILLFLILPISFFGQKNNYYYYNEQKIPLEIDTKYVNITYDASFQLSSLSTLNVISSPFDVMSCNPGEDEGKMAKIEFIVKPNQIEFLQKLNTLKNTNGIISVCLYY